MGGRRGWRVFVSHTGELRRWPQGRSFVDAAEDAVRRAGHERAEWVDLAPGPTSAEVSFRRVAECDVFLGVIGFCYGEPVDDAPAMSYPELEFQAATELGLPRIVVLLDEGRTAGTRELLVDTRYGDRQHAFRRRLAQAEAVTDKVATPAELTDALDEAFARLDAEASPDPDANPRGPRGPRADPDPSADGGTAAEAPNPGLVRTYAADRATPRDDVLGELVEAILKPGATVVGLTGLDGAGGFGTTTLAAMACADPRVRGAFPDGVGWTTLGRRTTGAHLIAAVNDLAGRLAVGPRPIFTELAAAGAHLGATVGARRCLLVVDDVWDAAQLRPFLAGAPSCVRVVTSRQRSVLPPDACRVRVDVLSESQARAVLAAGLPRGEQRTAALARRTRGWPLLCGLVNGVLSRQAAAGMSVAEAVSWTESALDTAGAIGFDLGDDGERARVVAAVVDVSLRLLDAAMPGAAERFADLAVFGEGTAVPIPTLARFWEHTAGLDRSAAEKLLVSYAESHLLADLWLDPPAVRVHDVVVDYLHDRAGAARPALHRAFLDAQRRALPLDDGRTVWWQHSDDDAYLWRELPYHLREAGRAGELDELLRDLRWTAGTIHVLGPAAVETDATGTSTDASVVALRQLVRQTAHLHKPGDRAATTAGILAAYAAGVPVLAQAAAELRRHLPRPSLTPISTMPDQPHPALRRTWHGHLDWVRALVVAPDGSWLASASDDHTVRVWDVGSGTERAVHVGHLDWVRALVAAPDGSWLASASDDATVRVWEVYRGGGTRTVLLGHREAVRVLVAGPDGSWLASAGLDGAVRVWDLASGAERTVLAGHARPVRAMVVSPDGSWLASASDDRTVGVWDLVRGAERAVLTGHTEAVTALAVAPDGSWLASASDDGTVRTWDAARAVGRAVLTGHLAPVGQLAVSPDGSWLTSADRDGVVRTWAMPGAELRETWDSGVGEVHALVPAPDGSWLVYGGRDGTVRVRDVPGGRSGRVGRGRRAAGNRTVVLTGHADPVRALAVAPGGDWLASASDDLTVRTWTTPTADTPSPAIRTGEVQAEVQALVAAPDGSWVGCATGGTVRLLTPDGDTERGELAGGSDWISALGVAPDGSWLACASGVMFGADHTVRLHDLCTGAERAVPTGHGAPVSLLSIAPDGSWAASAAGDVLNSDLTVRKWSVSTGAGLAVMRGHTDWVRALVVAPDGSWVASAGDDRTVRLWDAATGAERLVLTGPAAVRALAVAPDGSWIASACQDGVIRMWTADVGAELATFVGHVGAVRAVAAVEGGRLTSVGDDGTVRLWDVAEGAELAVMRTDSQLTACIVLPDRPVPPVPPVSHQVPRRPRLAVGGRRGLYLIEVVP